MDETPILVEQRSGYRIITLNRPQRLNALTEPMHLMLRDALAQAEADETCRALLLTGAGRGFCAGQDLNDRLSKAGETPVLCRACATAPTVGLALIRRALEEAGSNDSDPQLDLERELQREASLTPDYAEGVRAFMGKRPPAFTGRRSR